MFQTRTISRDLKSIPFDVCHQIYQDAIEDAEASAESANLEAYEQFLRRKEQEWSDTHEYPYEGNMSDLHPYVPTKNLAEIRRKAGQAAIVDSFIPRYKLDTIMQTWVMSQVIAWIARGPFNFNDYVAAPEDDISKTSETAVIEGQRKLDPLKMLGRIFDNKNAWDMGLYRFLMLDSRSCYLKTQYKGDAKQFCALVPLIMYAFKLHHGVKYSDWSKKNLEYVVNRSLYEAMVSEPPTTLTKAEILELREAGLVYKSGAKMGEIRSPETTYKIYDTADSPLHDLPDLAKTMVTQIWCAHPKNRTKYMILDPYNWDSMPAPLINNDIFAQTADFEAVKVTKPVTRNSVWD